MIRFYSTIVCFFAFHGYGTKSIRRIAESYGGSMTIHTEGDWFELRVLIPLSK